MPPPICRVGLSSLTIIHSTSRYLCTCVFFLPLSFFLLFGSPQGFCDPVFPFPSWFYFFFFRGGGEGYLTAVIPRAPHRRSASFLFFLSFFPASLPVRTLSVSVSVSLEELGCRLFLAATLPSPFSLLSSRLSVSLYPPVSSSPALVVKQK
ncbi:hypothetical protein BZA05DRAFT_402540 [Tricharina praecox]|uniref:uncharacterized protein n=1 Tax=Tricharina praecox TaxID=43433 RepID=UPI00221FABBD|nr:uncharacterized protein BZA05DRAFT_402540 [Tricharina praecox]KAI5849199.1 hypothetical protein BZA05DRAFT_402540 [Tricharina praecox]